jgi:3-hydroxyanthranilate 3,4-dioxygenase
MYQIKGEMRLHYRTPEGKEEVAVIPEGSVIHTPAGIPHSPRFPPDAFAMIHERKRAARRDRPLPVVLPEVRPAAARGELRRRRLRLRPVTKAYRNFFYNEQHRTCSRCGNVMPNEMEQAETAAAPAD